MGDVVRWYSIPYIDWCADWRTAHHRNVFTNGVLALQAVTLTNTGSFNITATSTSPSATGTSATFTVAAGAAATMTVIASGDNQTATVGTAVAFAPSVKIVDANSNPVHGLTVMFTPDDGSVTPAGGNATTNALGVATLTSWTLGSVAGTQSLVASTAGLASVTIHATATGFALTGLIGSIDNILR